MVIKEKLGRESIKSFRKIKKENKRKPDFIGISVNQEQIQIQITNVRKLLQTD